jgi:hypothetical protein
MAAVRAQVWSEKGMVSPVRLQVINNAAASIRQDCRYVGGVGKNRHHEEKSLKLVAGGGAGSLQGVSNFFWRNGVLPFSVRRGADGMVLAKGLGKDDIRHREVFSMKRILAIATLCLAALAAADTARAITVVAPGFAISVPLYATVAPPPVYVAPAYVPPPVYVGPAYAPPPVWVAPRAYGPRPVAVGPYVGPRPVLPPPAMMGPGPRLR